MADLTPEQAIDKLRALPEDKQRQVLTRLSPEERKGILAQLQGGTSSAAAAAPAKATGPTAEIESERQAYQKSGPVMRGVSSFESGFGIPQSVQQHPSVAAQGLKMAALHPGLELESLKEMWNSMNESQQQLINRAYFMQHSPGLANKANGFVLGIYSAIPLFGPAIVGAIDQWQRGDKAGAVGSLTAVGAQLYRPKGASVAEAGRPGEIRPPLLERVGQQVNKLKDVPRHSLQSSLGAGPRMSEKLLTRENESFASEKAKTADQNLKRQEAAHEANENTWAKSKGEQIQGENEYQEAVARVQQENAAQKAQVAQRETLGKEIDTGSVDLGKDIASLENAVYQEANHKFNVVKAKIGNPEVPSDSLVASVKDVEKNVLQDIPENVKEFRAILNLESSGEELQNLRKEVMTGQGMKGKYEDLSPQSKMLVDRIAGNYGGEITESAPLTWDKLQAIKSRIDARLRGRTKMNGDLKRGLFKVRDSVVDQMGEMAQTGGVSDDWDAARSFYRQWREDFHEPTGPSGSGSPVAQARDAVDPSKIRKPFARTQSNIGNRGVETLRKYAQFGGDKVADRAQKILASEREMEGLPKAYKEKPLPKRPELATGELRTPKMKKEPTTKGVDIETDRYNAIRDKFAQRRSLSKWEARTFGLLAIPERIVAWALDRPSVVDWVKQPTTADLETLDRMAPEVRKATLEAIKNLAVKEAFAKAKPLKFARGFETRMSAVGVVGAAMRVRNAKKPGEQLRDLRKIREIHSSNPGMPYGEEP